MVPSKCVQCGGKVKPGNIEHVLALGAQKFKAELPGTLCTKCNESYVSGPVLGAFEHAVARHLAAHGPATAESFRFMRKAIGLPAKELAELLRTTPETVSRWENGQHEVDLWAWVTLGSLVLDELDGRTTTRERLQAVRVKKLAKTVPIKLKAGSESAAE